MSRRNKVADILDRSALLRIIEALPRRDQLVVVNHHRIGDPGATAFDAEVFSATQEALAAQIALFKKDYELLTPSEALSVIEGATPLRGTAVLLTFDDGYLDNFELAAPALRAEDAEAVFFLVTGYLDDPEQIPWWDEIAWLARRCAGRRVAFTTPEPWVAEIAEDAVDHGIAQIMARFRGPGVDAARFFAELEAAAGARRADARGAERLLMNWDEAARLREMGVTIGLHTHSHTILSTLSEAEQRRELLECRRRMKERLGLEPDLFAYPVGSRTAFDETTERLVEEAGFTAAFSFDGGVNPAGAMERFDLKRLSFVQDAPHARVRASMAGMAVTGRRI